MTHTSAPHSERAQAASNSLRFGRDGIEIEDLAARIDTLEACAKAAEAKNGESSGRKKAMRLTHRLKRLERDHAPVAGACSTCGWPGTLIIAVVTTFHNDPLPRCSGCKRALNEEGRPLPNRCKRIIRKPHPCAA